jgi:hypothetical protein
MFAYPPAQGTFGPTPAGAGSVSPFTSAMDHEQVSEERATRMPSRCGPIALGRPSRVTLRPQSRARRAADCRTPRVRERPKLLSRQGRVPQNYRRRNNLGDGS